VSPSMTRAAPKIVGFDLVESALAYVAMAFDTAKTANKIRILTKGDTAMNSVLRNFWTPDGNLLPSHNRPV